MINLSEKSSIAFVFSDTAGGNACLAQGRLLSQNSRHRFVTNNAGFNASHWGTELIVKEKIDEEDLCGADVLFTGTSHPDTGKGFELQAISLAKQLGIPTISFIDHWTSFILRFSYLNQVILPDEIAVLDEHAKSLAIGEGLPSDKIVIRENPYHQYLQEKWKSRFNGKHYVKELGLSPEKKNIIIAPDPVSQRIDQSLIGFTEAEAVTDIIQLALKQLPDVQIIVKFHPLQLEKTFSQVIKQFQDKSIHFVREADSLEIINAGDLICGFYSNLLLDAKAMGKPVLRYFPGDLSLDPLKHFTGLPPVSKQQLPLVPLRELLVRYE